jgi:hypothetical protein
MEEYDFVYKSPKRVRTQPRGINEIISPSPNSVNSPLSLSGLGQVSPLIKNQQSPELSSPSVRKRYFDCSIRNQLNQKEKIAALLNEFAATHLSQFGIVYNKKIVYIK